MRPHRAPAGAIALALAVGLGALLVGLSVAPRVLPGDTFRLVPRTIAGAAVADDDPTDDRAQVTQTVDGATTTHAAHLAIVSMTGHAHPSRRRFGLSTPTLAPLTDRSVPRPGCRGPPHC